MASDKSVFLAQDVLNRAYRTQAHGAVTLHLYTTTPNPDGTGGVEVSDSGYAAQSLPGSAFDVPGAGNKYVRSNADKLFTPSVDILIDGYATKAGTNYLHVHKYDTPVLAVGGRPFVFPAGWIVQEL